MYFRAVALMMGGLPEATEGMDCLLLFVQGIFVMSLSFGLLTMAPSYISAAETSLYMLIETVLGPVWVYIGGYEQPPPMTVYGGIILIVALASNR